MADPGYKQIHKKLAGQHYSSRLDDSPVGKDLLKFKHIYLVGKKVEAQDGENAIFSLDC